MGTKESALCLEYTTKTMSSYTLQITDANYNVTQTQHFESDEDVLDAIVDYCYGSRGYTNTLRFVRNGINLDWMSNDWSQNKFEFDIDGMFFTVMYCDYSNKKGG